MDAPTERKRTDPKSLYYFLEEFFRDNQHHHSVEYRWLAQKAIGLKTLAYNLDQSFGTFQKKYAVELAELRLAEIEKERDTIASADKKLADEAARLKRNTSRDEAAAA